MKRLCTVSGLAIVGFASIAIVIGSASASRASWVSNNCSPYHFSDSIFQRKTSQSYAAVAVGEGTSGVADAGTTTIATTRRARPIRTGKARIAPGSCSRRGS